MPQATRGLDNELIYNLIVRAIKAFKKVLQMIVVTHNANIVVNGDSEYVHCLKVARGQARSQARIIQFDEQAVHHAGEDSLSQDLCLKFVHEDDASALLKRRILVRRNGNLQASVAGILMCCMAPEERLSNSYICAVCYWNKAPRTPVHQTQTSNDSLAFRACAPRATVRSRSVLRGERAPPQLQNRAAVTDAARNWLLSEMASPETNYCEVALSQEQITEAAWIAHQLPDHVFDIDMWGRKGHGDPLIIGEAVVQKVELLSTKNFVNLDHEVVNNWVSTVGRNSKILYDPNESLNELSSGRTPVRRGKESWRANRDCAQPCVKPPSTRFRFPCPRTRDTRSSRPSQTANLASVSNTSHA